MTKRIGLLCLLVTAWAFMAGGGAAIAQGGDDGSIGGSAGSGRVTVAGGVTAGGGGSDDGVPTDVRTVGCGSAGAVAVDGCGSAQIACAVDGGVAKQRVAVVRQRLAGGRWHFVGTDCVTPQAARVTAELVRERVSRLIPSAGVGLAPRGTSLVNIETVMWADAPRRQSLPAVQILGRRVVVELRLDHVAWDFGDGARDGSGPASKAYDKVGDPCRSKQCAHYFGHTYARTGAVTVRATASWSASFTVDGGRAMDIPGTVDGPTSTAPLSVKQARGVLVPNPGEH